MAKSSGALGKKLRGVADTVAALEKGDRDGLARAGAQLEALLGKVNKNQTQVAELIRHSLGGLKTIYKEPEGGWEQVTGAIAASLNLVAESGLVKGGEEVTAEADRSLQAALESTGGADEQVKPYVAYLNYAASLLMQAEPDDLDVLDGVSTSLSEGIESYPPALEALVRDALQKIAAVLKGEAQEVEAAIAEIGDLIDEAMMLAGDGMASGSTRQPGAGKGAAGAPQKKEQQAAAGGAGSRPGPDREAGEIAEDDEVIEVPSELPPEAEPSMLGDYITESREYIEDSEGALLDLEKNPEDNEAICTVFRAFHTIKGTSAFLGLSHIKELAHKAETLLSRIREGEIKCTGGYADLALRSIDMLNELMAGIEGALSGQPLEKPGGYDDLIRILKNPEIAGVCELDSVDLPDEESGSTPEPEKAAAEGQGEAAKPDTSGAARKKAAPSGKAVESVRVSTARLDRLVNMVGELVIAHSMVAQDSAAVAGGNTGFLRKVNHASKIIRELQDLSMGMRMIPLRGTFQKMARVARDVARKRQRDVRFLSEGGDTEMDRNMVDIVGDPLVHMVRNAVDHGIETPADRKKAGKPATGTVCLSACHSGGSVIVEIRDDGRGLDRRRIARKAIDRGLIESDLGMTDSEVYSLIFEPGFSTADMVTEVSGRGVGLDVVKKGIEALRGRIDITSELGKGCIFSLRLPLTMAIIDGMVVGVGQERYIFQALSVVRSVKPEAGNLSSVLNEGEMLMVDGRLIPLYRLGRIFEVEGAQDDLDDGIVVIVEGDNSEAGFFVDRIIGKQQVVIKSLGESFRGMRGVSGGAIMPDGNVGLILDVGGLVDVALSGQTEAAVMI